MLKYRIYRKKHQLLIHWKGDDEIEVPWKPLDTLHGASTSLSIYRSETYNETIPFISS